MITREKLSHHIAHLEIKHRTLDEQIDSLESNGLYEDEELHFLKKKRLSIKDEIESLKSQLAELV